jgi:NADPH-dependent 2,4-dienoyl-CoA reductase/sulfur reductase-like enzyme
MSDTFVVTGGDAAGTGAASKAGRENLELDVVSEKGEWVSDAACGMSSYGKGEGEDLEGLVADTPEEFREKRDVGLRTGPEVVGSDPEGEGVTVEGDGEPFDQPSDHLLVATALTAGTTVTELRDADLACALPFRPVWDPILTAATVLEGGLAGK